MPANHPDKPWGHYRLSLLKRSWLAVCHRIHHRRLNLWFRSPLKRLVGGWVDTRIWGLRLRIATTGNLSEQRLLYSPDDVDRTERLAIADALSHGGVFLDIGANAGVYSLWVAATCGERVAVEAFEPDPKLCARLGENLRRNELSVRLHPIALGEEDGTATLVRGRTNLGCNQVLHDASDGEEITVRRLSRVLRSLRIDAIDALKIDIEGGEFPVLRPMFEDLPSHAWPKVIVCELSGRPDTDPVGQLLVGCGYRLQAETRMNAIFTLNRDEVPVRQSA